jgi:putative heme iron utilization protein
MEDRRAGLLRSLLSEQLVGALGTLHHGKPAVSMVPFAISPVSQSLVIHVSRLATHTQDMEAEPSVGFLVIADRDASVVPQARARLSIAGRAARCAPDAADYEAARSAYLARFPESEPMFGFEDFSLFLIEPESVRVVGGFAQAWSLTRERFLQAMTAWQASAR